MMGRILTSSHKEKALEPFEADEPISEKFKAYIYRTAIMSIGTVFKDTEEFAANDDCLAALPDVKDKLRQLPAFD